MSQENVEIVRRMYETWNRGGRDAASDLAERDFADDFELTFKVGPQAGTHKGRAQAEAALDDLLAGFDSWRFESLEFTESGDQVVVTVNNLIRPKGGTSGEFGYRNGAVWTIRDGTIVSLVGYPTPEEALEAVGRSE